MTSHNPFSSKSRETESNYFSIPCRLQNLYSSPRRLECVASNNGSSSIFSDLVHTSYFEGKDEAHQDLESEVRSLREALNLPVESLLQHKDCMLNKHGGTSIFAVKAYSCDSGYSSRSDQQSLGNAAARNGHGNTIGLTFDCSPAEMKTNVSSINNDENHSSRSFYEKSLKSSLEESETKRMLLLEKLREAHLAIKNQAEKLATTESEMCYLRGQLKSAGLEQEGLQQEVDSLVMEKRTFEVFRVENMKKHGEFLSRINDLDKAFKVLAASHNFLQAEMQKKETILKQTTLQLNAVEQEKNSLQEEYQKIAREQAVIKHQLSERKKVIQEARQKQESMNQEIVQLKIERDIQHGKVSVLEDEILQHQQNHNHLVREQEIVLKEKAEQERRLQREIQEKMSLKMVYGLLEEESANVKEAFKKLEQFTTIVERRSKELSEELDHYKQRVPTSRLEEMTEVQTQNGDLLLKIDHLHIRCKELERIQQENVELRKEYEKLSSSQVHLEAEQKKLLETNEKLSLQVTKMKGKEDRTQQGAQQEEVEILKENITRLESEKVQLMSELSKLREDEKAWILQRSELQMSKAELNAENNQLRSELNKESFHDVCLELKNVKSELSKVWDMLELKEKQFEEQTQELEQEREQSQRWAEEVTRLRKSCTELTAKTFSRGQMVATLRDELTQRCDEITNLEAKLTAATRQKCSPVETSNEKRVGAPELKRRRSDGDIYMTEEKGCGHSMMIASDNNAGEIKKVAAKNSQLNQRIQELLVERDAALHDAQDLLNGMQQLREAFEEEMERELEQERNKFEKEKEFLQAQQVKRREGDQQLFEMKSKLRKEVNKLSEEKTALEIKSENLEFERDELRNQVEELCKMRTAAEEKAVQVDSVLSPRKRENKALSTGRRSSSVGMVPPRVAIKEVPDSHS